MTFIQPNLHNFVKNNPYLSVLNTNQRQNSPVSFGYDKQLSDKVNKNAIAGEVPEIITLQNMCNEVEDRVRSNEKTFNEDYDTYINIYTMLIPLKVALTKLVESYFPSLQYSKKEVKHYNNEAEVFTNNKIHLAASWRNSIGIAIEEAMEEDDFDENYRDDFDCNDFQVTGGDSSKKKSNSIIKIFQPNEYTPKGFIDVAGMDQVKEELQKWIIDPIKDPEINNKRKQYGIKMPNGFMLYGPPGCGKTFIAEALAAEADIPLFKLKISEAGSSYIHESSKNYRLAFEEVEQKAKEINKPCILFIDEIDGLASSRESLGGDNDFKVEEINTLLDLLQGASARGIIVLGATNNPGGVDKAIKRSGRFDKELYVGLPDVEARISKIKIDLTKREKAQSLLNNEVILSEIAQKTDGFSNSDIDVILENAAMNAMKRNDEITLTDVLNSVEDCNNKKLSPSDLEKYNIEPIKNKIIGFNSRFRNKFCVNLKFERLEKFF
ncbi:MAG: ATP-binding protein [Candidatus Gastranaerophilales bacterium]|nr:ATP-binding protein [Candidatus Gastranaerophilales bacterium]